MTMSHTGQAGKREVKKSRTELTLFQLLFVQVLEKLLESVVVESKRVHRIYIEFVVEIDPTVFQVIVAAAFRGWLLLTTFMVVTAFTDQWKSSCLWRYKLFILIRHVARMAGQPFKRNFYAIIWKLSIVFDSNILYCIVFCLTPLIAQKCYLELPIFGKHPARPVFV